MLNEQWLWRRWNCVVISFISFQIFSCVFFFPPNFFSFRLFSFFLNTLEANVDMTRVALSSLIIFLTLFSHQTRTWLDPRVLWSSLRFFSPFFPRTIYFSLLSKFECDCAVLFVVWMFFFFGLTLITSIDEHTKFIKFLFALQKQMLLDWRSRQFIKNFFHFILERGWSGSFFIFL